MTGSRFTIGRAQGCDLVVNDSGVSSTHASIYREGNRIWILDEGSANGTGVNGSIVPPVGVSLHDGAEISLGDEATIVVVLAETKTEPAWPIEEFEPNDIAAAVDNQPSNSFTVWIVAGLLATLVVLAGVIGVVSYAISHQKVDDHEANNGRVINTETPIADTTPTPQASAQPTGQVVEDALPSPNETQVNTTRKLYLQMTPAEQMEFIDQQARHISLMMGNRPYSFNDDVLRYIKQYLDGYAKRVGNNSNKLWGEDLRFMFARAREQFAPYIIRAFNARGVPPVVGLYLVVVETEYHNIQSENAAGAAGLFQFIGPTARGYGVEPSERTNVAKMAPAAAAYMADRIAEFGPDSMSVALGIAGYNRSPDSVRRDLHDVLNSENRERSFWTLIANSDKLDHYFQGENIKYVPKFFAAAIVGETPWAFGIQMQPLSTYTEIKSAPTTAEGQ